MTDRDEQLELLTAYLDDEASPAERAEVEALLERDPEARRLLDELRQVSRLVGSLPQASAPGGFSESVVARLERDALLGDAGGAKRRWTLGNWGALAASIALVVAAGWFIMPQLSRLPHGSTVRSPVASSDEVVARSDKPVELHEEYHTSGLAKKASPAGPARTMSVARRVETSNEMLEMHPLATLEPPAEPTPPLPAMRLTKANPAPNPLLNCVAVQNAAEVDQSLNAGKLTPNALANARNDAFTNQIVVVVPNDADIGVVQRAVEGTLSKHAVANLDSVPKDKPIDRRQCFYANQLESRVADAAETAPAVRPEAKSKKEAAAAGDQVGRQFVLNIPREQTKDLIADMQSACVANGIDSNYDVNGKVFGNSADPNVVADNLVSVVDADTLDVGAMGDTFADNGVALGKTTQRPYRADHESSENAVGGNAGSAAGAKTDQPVSAKPELTKKSDDDDQAHRAGASANEPEKAEGQRDKAVDEQPTRAAPGSRTRATPHAEKERKAVAGPGNRAQTGESMRRGRSRRAIAADKYAGFVGPPAPEPVEPQDLVTCVVTIRPATASRSATEDAETKTRPAQPSHDFGGRANRRAPASKPTTSRPAGGSARG